MAHPLGCTMTGKNKIKGQCDAKSCNYPFCEASEPRRLTKSEIEMANSQMRLGHQTNSDSEKGWYQ